MVKQLVNIGAQVNDGTGDTLRIAFSKVNDNFTELYINNPIKILLDVPTSFYIDEIVGVDTITDRDGTDILLPFKSLLYCLVYIRDTYIIGTEIYIELLTNVTLPLNTQYYTLKDFSISAETEYPYLIIRSYETYDSSLVRIKNTIFIYELFSLNAIDAELNISLQFLNIETLTGIGNYNNLQIVDCKSFEFFNVNFKNTSIYAHKCNTLTFSSDFNAYFLLENSSIRFFDCAFPEFYRADLNGNSYISFELCHGFIPYQSKYLRISGTRTINSPYLSYSFCKNLGFLYGVSVSSSATTLTAPLVYIKDCLEIALELTLSKSTLTPNIIFAPQSGRYLYEIINSQTINLSGGSDLKKISGSTNALKIDNLSNLVTPTTSASILNAPIVNLSNLISPEAFINDSNYRSLSGLTQTTQSAAIDNLATKLGQKPAALGSIIYVNSLGSDSNILNTGFTIETAVFSLTKAISLLDIYDWRNTANTATIQIDKIITESSLVVRGTNWTGLSSLTLEIVDIGVIDANISFISCSNTFLSIISTESTLIFGANSRLSFSNCGRVYVNSPFGAAGGVTNILNKTGNFITAARVEELTIELATFQNINLTGDLISLNQVEEVTVDIDFLNNVSVTNFLNVGRGVNLIKFIGASNTFIGKLISFGVTFNPFIAIDFTNLLTGSVLTTFPSTAVINGADYTNTTSGLTSTTKQSAIDELSLLTKLTVNATIFTNNGTALLNQINLVNSSALRSITVPSTTTINSRFSVVDATGQAATNNISILFTGSKLFGVTNDTYILNVDKASVQFIYTGTTTGWITN